MIRRGNAFRRIWLTGEVVSFCRFGQTVESINHQVSEQMGKKSCLRTTLRDLQFLEAFGLVERDALNKWRWLGIRRSVWFAHQVDELRRAQ